ncbi:MAG: MFS transporter [Acidothermales bacterium]|nr:MFS transporter [Acidothermales bacterium]
MSADVSALARPAHRDPNVVRWLTAYTASVTGDVVYFLALSWTAARVAGPSQVGLVVAAGALPRAVLMLSGGVVADRFGPHRIAVASDTTRCLVIGAVAAAFALASPGIGLLIGLAVIFGVVDALFMPAVGALPPRITTSGQLARVQGMRGLSIRLSNAVGPLLAGVVLAAGGSGGAFTTASALFALSLLLLMTVRTTTTRPAGRWAAWRGLGEGLRYLRHHGVLAPLVAVIGLSEMCFSGPVALGLVLLAHERGWGAAGMGWIASAFSIGGGLAALLIAVRPHLRRAGLIMSGWLLAAAAGATGIGYAPNLPAATALGALVGLASGITTTLTSSLVQTTADPAYLGRVTSVTTLCTLGLAPILFPAVSATVAAWGAAAFFTGCAGICLVAATLGAIVPALRNAELRSATTTHR